MALAGEARLCWGIDAETKGYLNTKVAELLAEMDAGFSRLARGPDSVGEEPGDHRTDPLRDIRWELATLKNRVASSKNELAAIQHTLAILESRLKEIEREQVA